MAEQEQLLSLLPYEHTRSEGILLQLQMEVYRLQKDLPPYLWLVALSPMSLLFVGEGEGGRTSVLRIPLPVLIVKA